MAARYIIRFDDICPSMNWDSWGKVESVLIAANVKPILAIVPNNRDPKLNVMALRQDFWAQVRRWQSFGWVIALHGYEHWYETTDSGLVGINQLSEFAGVSRKAQLHKLQEGLRIFAENGVVTDTWVAPGHSFDAITVELLNELGVKIISDGFYFRPVSHLGVTWVPQQLWRFHRFPFGIWTVCYHSNNFNEDDIKGLANDLMDYRSQLIGLDELIASKKPVSLTFMDRLFAWVWLRALCAKRLIQ